MNWRLFLIVLVVLCSGCGGGGGSSNEGGWKLAAHAFNELGAGADKSRVLLVWTPPQAFRGGSVSGTYEILRNGAVISTFALGPSDFTDGADPAHPLTPGTSYTYTIHIKRTGSTTPDSISPSSGRVTPLVRPIVTSPTPSQPLATAVLTFQTVEGADRYICEFSAQPSFTTKVTLGPFSQAPGTQVTTNFNLTNGFLSLPAGQPIYFRVGAANSQDKSPPLSNDVLNGDSYIYSPAPYGSFTKQ